jgi:signal transduction histidine kinase
MSAVVGLVCRHPWWLALAGFVALCFSSTPAFGDSAGMQAASQTMSAADPDSFFGHMLKEYVPRRFCVYEEAPLIWLHVISDSIIAIAYYSIPIALVYFVRKRKDLVFNWVFVCFAVFILACGAGHVLSVLAIWHPVYRLEGIVKLITAVASVGTAIVLWPLIPRALALPSPSQLQTANNELEAFSYSVSHNLRALLRHLDGISQALIEDYADKLDEEGKDNLRRIRSASQRMGQLIDDLLNLSKVSRLQMKRERTNLSKIAQEIAQELRGTAPDREVEFVIHEGMTANADPSLLRVALTNLLGNARKFTSKIANARIEFGNADPNSADTYVVRDNGAGFDMAYAGKLFQEFQRFHTLEEFPGTGIGLATVKRIIQRHGGKVWADAKVGAGATFYFKLQG